MLPGLLGKRTMIVPMTDVRKGTIFRKRSRDLFCLFAKLVIELLIENIPALH